MLSIEARRGERNARWIVLALSVALVAGLMATGLLADSSSLIASGLINGFAALMCAMSLYATGRPAVRRRRAARTSSLLLIGVAIGVAADAGYRFIDGSDPIGMTMIVMSIHVSAVNFACLWLIRRCGEPDVSIRAARTFIANSLFANAAIGGGGALVLLLGSNRPDLLVGVLVAGIVVNGGINILCDALQVKRTDADVDPEPNTQS